jgi:hypothetical protein
LKRKKLKRKEKKRRFSSCGPPVAREVDTAREGNMMMRTIRMRWWTVACVALNLALVLWWLNLFPFNLFFSPPRTSFLPRPASVPYLPSSFIFIFIFILIFISRTGENENV